MDSHLNDFIGKVVLFQVSPQFLKEAQVTIQLRYPTPFFYGELLAVDGIGCWVENSSWRTTEVKTDKVSTFVGHTLIPWAYIVSAVAFPDRVFADIPADGEDTTIGVLSKLRS